MQKNWYIVYTKPCYEKKVASLLTKRKIENFCPLNCRRIKSFRITRTIREPLFKSYVFVNIARAEIALIKELRGAINILYWQDEPAIIKQDEIEAIKEFTNDRRDIELKRVPVDMHDVSRVFDDTYYSMDGNILAVNIKAVRVTLPSLGYIMMATIEDGSFFGRAVPAKAFRGITYSEARANKDN